jgi:hypothetical protein
MSTTPEVITSDNPTPAPAPATPWWKRKRFIIPGAVLVLAVIGSTMDKGSASETQTPPLVGSAASAMAAGASAGAAAASPKPAPPAAPTYHTPKTSDYKVNAKITEKTCFGSAGCNVRVKTTLTIVGASAENLDPTKTYELTYEILGGSDGAIINTMEVTGTQYSGRDEEYFTIPTSGTKVTTRITDIEEE